MVTQLTYPRSIPTPSLAPPHPALRSLNNEGNLLYSGGEDKSIVVWAVDGAAGTGKLLNSLEGAHDKWVRSLRLTPDSRTLVSGSADTTIGLWEVEPQGGAKLLQVLRWHTDRVRCVRVSPDGRCVCVLSAVCRLQGA